MASGLIGRTDCPECGFGAAHVKKKEQDGKRPYRYCPECGAQYYTRSDAQAAALMAKTRPEATQAVPVAPEPVAAVIVETAPDTQAADVSKPQPKKSGDWSKGIFG